MATDRRPAPGDATPLERLVDLARCARDDSLMDVLAAVASTVTDVSGFKVVLINLYRPAWVDYEAVLVRGNPAAEQALLGTRVAGDQFSALLDTQPPTLPGVWFFRSTSREWVNFPPSYTPEITVRSDPHAWDPEDGIIVTLTDSAGQPLGFLSIDEPVSGLEPTLAELELLRAICRHAEQALETARHHRRVEDGAVMNAHLLTTSRDLVAADSEAAAYAVLCAAVTGLGFGRATAFRRTSPTGLELQDLLGWGTDRPPTLAVDAEGLERLLADSVGADGLLLCAAHLVFAGVPAPGRPGGRIPGGWDGQVLVAPIWDAERRMMGALVVDEPDEDRLPSNQQRELLRLLGDQAGAVLTRLALETLHRRLLGLVLVREGAPALAATLAEIVQAPVAVLDWLGQVIAEAAHAGRTVVVPTLSDLSHIQDTDGGPAESSAVSGLIVRQLRLGGRVGGVLVVDASGRPGSVRAMAVDQAAMSFALHLAMAANAEEVEHRLRGSLIDELLEGDAVDGDAVARRARRLGHDLSRLTLAIAVQPAHTRSRRSALTYLTRTVQRVIEEAGAGGIVAPHRDSVLALVEAPPGEEIRSIGDAVVSAAAQQLGVDVSVGISRGADTPAGLGGAIREAQLAVRAGRTVPSLGEVTLAGELDFHHLLLTAPKTDETTAAARRLLGPLLEEGENSERLLLTLRTYLEAVGHLQTTADQLGIHVNSLRNRLTRIEHLLSRDLRNARTRVDLHLALEMFVPRGAEGEARL